MLVLFIVLLCQVELALGDGEAGYTALKFGQSSNSYISFTPDMRPFENVFTVCSWIKKIRPNAYSTWFKYSSDEILMSDDGYYNYLFGGGGNVDLRSKFTTTHGSWHHHCDSWSYDDRTLRVYLNGKLVGTGTTASGRRLSLGGTLLIGNYSPGHSQYFGGEMYQLNVYNKELSASEVSDMAAGGPCPGVEELYNDDRMLKWDTILQQTRTGNVKEVDIDTRACKLVNDLREIKSQLNQTESRLNETLDELAETQERLNTTALDLNKTALELNSTALQLNKITRDLEYTQQKLNTTALDLDKTALELNSTALQLNKTTRDLEYTQQKLNSTAHELNVVTKQLENDGSTQMDLLYSQPFFNEVFTKELYMKLSSSWDIVDDFVARVRITKGLMSHFKDHHKKDTCDPDGEM